MAQLYIRYPSSSATVSGDVTVVQPDGSKLHCTVDASALPSGAATSAKQPALGVAGTASADVITVQGIASMTPLKVDASGVTITVAGTVAATQSGAWTVSATQSGAWTTAATQSGTWNINNISGTVSLPTGAATETTLASIDTKTPALGQALMSASSPVVIASNQSAVPISATSLPLPTGAATSAKQPALGTAGSASADVITVQGIASMTALKVDGSAVTQPVSGTVSATQGTAAALGGAWPVKVTDGTNTMPTMDAASRAGFYKITDGTNTAAVKAASTPAVAADPALVVALSPNNPVTTSPAGRTVVNRARLDYSSTSVTTSAYVQLLASTSGAITMIEIFDSSGQTLLLATGGAGSEVDQIYILPGGNGQVPLAIAGSTRISIKAVSGTANAGEIDINFYS